jgi:hypothetical protein
VIQPWQVFTRGSPHLAQPSPIRVRQGGVTEAKLSTSARASGGEAATATAGVESAAPPQDADAKPPASAMPTVKLTPEGKQSECGRLMIIIHCRVAGGGC